MRHRKKFNHLGRQAPHRKAMLANMASSLILHKRITTTTAKAKALRVFVEPVITRSKDDSTHSRRVAFRYLRDKEAVTELFRDVAGKIGDRPGGYTRIIKLGNRLGDNADMCIIELVDYNETLLADKAAAKPKSTRRRRSGGKKSTDEAAGATDAANVESTEDAVEITEAEVVEGNAETEVVAEAEVVTEAEVVAEETVEEKAEPEAKAEVEEVKEEVQEEKVEPEAKVEEVKEEVKEEKAEPEAKAEETPSEEETKEGKKEE